MNFYRKISIPEFEHTIGEQLSTINSIFQKRHRIALRKFDITTLQGFALSFIAEAETSGGITQSDLCSILSVTPPAVLKMTVDLNKKELVYKTDNPNDQRSQLLFPTEAGRKVSAEFRKIVTDEDDDVFSVCTEQEKKFLMDILDKVISSYR